MQRKIRDGAAHRTKCRKRTKISGQKRKNKRERELVTERSASCLPQALPHPHQGCLSLPSAFLL